MSQLIWNHYFQCTPHLLLLENDFVLSDFTTKVFQNSSFTSHTKLQLFLAMVCYLFCFDSHYHPFDGIDAELCCVVSVCPSAYNANMVVTSTIHIFIPLFDLFCHLFCQANLLWSGSTKNLSSSWIFVSSIVEHLQCTIYTLAFLFILYKILKCNVSVM